MTNKLKNRNVLLIRCLHSFFKINQTFYILQTKMIEPPLIYLETGRLWMNVDRYPMDEWNIMSVKRK
jgi:hypothetical protein